MPEETPRERFERVVMPHLDAAYSLARWLLGDGDEAADAVQDAMLRAFRYLPSCRDQTARHWVLRIVRNVCYDALAARMRVPATLFTDLEPDEGEGGLVQDALVEPAPDPERMAMAQDERKLVNELLAALSPQLREVIVLKEMEGLSYREIAEVTGIALGTVMSRLSRARGALATEWKKRHGRD